MHRHRVLALGLALFGMLCAGITAPSSPGELSVQPRILVGSAATPSAHVVSKPIWRHELFAAAANGAPIVSDSDAAYLSMDQAVCAVALANGKDRWCQGSPASSIALSGDTLATVESDGVIRGRDKKTGAVSWRNVIGPATLPTAKPTQQVWPTRLGFLALRPLAGGGTAVAEIRTDGDVMWAWSSDVPIAGPPLLSSEYAAFNGATNAAVTTSHTVIFKLGQDGGQSGALVGGLEPLEIRLPNIYSQLSLRDQASSEYSLAFDVFVDDVQPGVAHIHWHYAPDQDANSRLPYSGPNCCGSSSKRVGIDERYVYGAVGERIYRYMLAPPDGQRPILMSDEGMFIAGPYAGRIYVARPDGVWAISFNGSFLNQMLVAPYRLPVVESRMAFDGGVGYVAMTDGRILAFRLDSGEPVIRARVACSQFAGIRFTRSRVLFACAAPQASIVAFAR